MVSLALCNKDCGYQSLFFSTRLAEYHGSLPTIPLGFVLSRIFEKEPLHSANMKYFWAFSLIWIHDWKSAFIRCIMLD